MHFFQSGPWPGLEKVSILIYRKLSSAIYRKVSSVIFRLQLAGLTEKVTITKTISGIKKSITYEKYELISCHTGRRSMISNCILEGISTSSIMLMSAHKSLKVFQGYVRITKKQNADALGNHSFFK
jgi:hypothetical protein